MLQYKNRVAIGVNPDVGLRLFFCVKEIMCGHDSPNVLTSVTRKYGYGSFPEKTPKIRLIKMEVK